MGAAAPKVPIELDKPRHMQFTFGVAERFEEHTGKDFAEVSEDLSKLSFKDIVTMLWLTLAVEDKELTREVARDLFHFKNLQEYLDKLGEVLNVSTPESDGDDPKEAAFPQTG